MSSALYRISIVDNHPWALRAICQFIQSQADLSVSQTAAEWHSLLASPSRPNLIVLDWESPGAGKPAVNQLRAAMSDVRIVAMGVWLSSQQNALAAGVDGFISKTDSPDQVLAALRKYVDPPARSR